MLHYGECLLLKADDLFKQSILHLKSDELKCLAVPAAQNANAIEKRRKKSIQVFDVIYW